MAAMKTAVDPGLASEGRALVWPEGAHVAVWIAPRLQYARAPGAAADDYGHRAGWWRLMELLDGLGLRASVFVDARDALRGTDILQACAERRWELGGCVREGDDGGRTLQAREVALACETLRALSGESLAGWRAGAGPLDEASLAQLAGAGLSYATNIHCLDHPRQLSLRAGPMVEVPLCDEASDQRCLVEHGLTAARYARLISDQFEQLHLEGATRATVLGLPLHPALIGLPQNLSAFGAVLAEIASRDKVWVATARDIAQWVLHGRHAQTLAQPAQGDT